MRKLLLFGLAASISFTVQAQNSKVKFAPGVKAYPVSGIVKPQTAQKATVAMDNDVPYRIRPEVAATPSHSNGMKSMVTFTEEIIGNSVYDLQSNRGTAKRISNNGDGTLSAAWTFTPVGGSNGVDRGTGYNYYNGTSWNTTPAARIEPIRTGFTNIDYTAAGGEWVVAHTGAQGLLSSHRATKGTGAWDTISVGSFNLLPSQADVWARFAVGGAAGNSIHVIVNSQGTGTTPVLGQNGPLTYSRSTDGGATWVDNHIQIPGTGAAFMAGVGAEEYHIDARGDVIAIVTSGFTNDVSLFKSLDNGATWTKTQVFAFPLGQPFDDATMNTDTTGDGIGEQIETNAGDATVTIDNNNVCHVAWGHMVVSEDVGAAGVSFFPTDDTGILYWHEGMAAPMIIASVEDFNGNGQIDIPTPVDTVNDNGFGNYNVGAIAQPSIGVDAANNIYIAYSAFDERADTTAWQQIMRHIFVVSSNNGGANWSWPYTLNPSPDGDFQEGAWPSVASVVDGDVHIYYQRDPAPGHSLSNNATQAANNLLSPSDQIYVRLPVTVLGLNDNNSAATSSDWVSSNYPNPVKDFTSINVQLTKTSDVTLEVTNMVGQLMFTERQTALAAGTHSITLNLSNLDAGVYFYNITAGDQKVSRKMIVE